MVSYYISNLTLLLTFVGAAYVVIIHIYLWYSVCTSFLLLSYGRILLFRDMPFLFNWYFANKVYKLLLFGPILLLLLKSIIVLHWWLLNTYIVFCSDPSVVVHNICVDGSEQPPQMLTSPLEKHPMPYRPILDGVCYRPDLGKFAFPQEVIPEDEYPINSDISAMCLYQNNVKTWSTPLQVFTFQTITFDKLCQLKLGGHDIPCNANYCKAKAMAFISAAEDVQIRYKLPLDQAVRIGITACRKDISIVASAYDFLYVHNLSLEDHCNLSPFKYKKGWYTQLGQSLNVLPTYTKIFFSEEVFPTDN